MDLLGGSRSVQGAEGHRARGRADVGNASVSSALERVLDAGQRLLADRIDLGRLELQDALSRTLAQLGVLVGGMMLATAGWIGFVVASALLMGAAGFPVPLSLLVAGLATCLAGGLLIRAVVRKPADKAEDRDGRV